ncbi:flagellar biosynthesis anti-sigma factor FlgM [Inhella proteolytica]|uniref:Negative regulator of flagellin synthesis n=1 Tax=Inhella proteolytica TaxID=2795029 RepID=A0A931NFP2_9BURK|nr:flagellar biosynthesis anti-sigma factor FlgM [Inhella proteolytica]MBH9575838.1 flagellar biosynthesis anti-sigma factor FlgM [Inhella proteolytica]
MEIGNNPNRPVQQPAQERSARPELSPQAGRAAAPAVQPNQTGARPEPVNANPPASAQVALSSSAVQLLKGSDDQDSFDTAKVERLSRDIEEGRFEVDAEAVADRLIANTRELLSSRKSSET